MGVVAPVLSGQLRHYSDVRRRLFKEAPRQAIARQRRREAREKRTRVRTSLVRWAKDNPRFIQGMVAARRDTLHSYPTIGKFLGKDHTTVLYGVHAHIKRTGAPDITNTGRRG